MRALAVVLILLLASCSQKPVKVEKRKVIKPTYYAPLKGNLVSSGRGFFFAGKCSDFVRAVSPGKVVYAGRDVGSYGWVVIVEQDDGFVSVYGKLDKPWVRTGERVKGRQVIGKAGRWKDACGVYYELRTSSGEPVKPVLR